MCRTRRAVRSAVFVAVTLGAWACSSTTADRLAPPTAADRQLAADVQNALARHPYLDADHLWVEARSGVVYLRGSVPKADDLLSVIRTVHAVQGVQRVENDVAITDFGMDRGRR